MSSKTQTYVILHVDHAGDNNDYKAFDNIDAANKGWKGLMNKAFEAATDNRGSFVIRQYTIELPSGTDVNSIDAEALIKDKSAVQDRWTKVRSPVSFERLIRTSGPNVVTQAIIEKAQKVIDDKAEEFPDWARDSIIKIEDTLQHILIEIDNESDEIPDMKDGLYHRYYILRGQGGTFGFDMVTTGCAMSCQLLDGIKTIRSKDIESLNVILDGIKLILRQPELKDDEAVCAALSHGFGEVVKKALSRNAKRG